MSLSSSTKVAASKGLAMFNRRRLTLTAVAVAALLVFAWSWREGQGDNAARLAGIHAAGLDDCPVHARQRWRGELICDKFYVDHPGLMTPPEQGAQRLYDERERPVEFRK